MRSRVNHRLVLVGAAAVVVLILVMSLVPAISGDGVNQVGTSDPNMVNEWQTCWLVNPETGLLDPDFTDPSPEIVDSRVEYYPDLNALMKCEYQIPDFTGPASVITTDTYDPATVGCVVALAPDAYPAHKPLVTDKWQQTTSADGQVKLSCRFKRN